MPAQSARIAVQRQALGEETREALINAATAVFIDDGYRAARVQNIASRAGHRLSAINYHFGGKEGLYRAVLLHHAEQALRNAPLPAPDQCATPREALQAAIAALVRRFLDPHSGSRIGALMLRELTNPTSALDTLIERFSLPQAKAFRALLAAVLGPAASNETLNRALLSVFGQCMVYVTARPLIERIAPEVLTGDALVARIAAHITDFSWGGLMALKALQENPQ